MLRVFAVSDYALRGYFVITTRFVEMPAELWS
jgi:hypothetical protein